jgi:GTP diphosphokinase / guanosine-3',5'-bis(diphosphate) 3'-diphosphatase
MLDKNSFLKKIKHFKKKEQELIIKAFDTAKVLHKNQKRDSGEEYFIHPLTVALILITLNLDADSICVALLHDTVEDTRITIKDIKKNFSESIGLLVDGLTKLSKLKFNSNIERNAENFRKLLVAISGDIRVLIIKLADRLHNMRTIGAISEEQRRIKISEETLFIFAPLAERIGMYKVKNELEDLAFKQTHPEESKTISEGIQKTKKTKKDVINDIIEQLIEEIKDKAGIKCLIYGREKKPYSIWKKMREKNISFEYLCDIIAFRVIVDDISNCYKVLGIINSKYKMIPNTFKDYISTPKENGYQSLHTVIVGPKNIKLELQIRTQKMHNVAEFGIASHWLYKYNSKDIKFLNKYRWIRELVTTFEHSRDIINTYQNTKLQVYDDEVFCFTPKGDIFNLPKGSTVLDFAYAIHSDIGNKCIGGKINGTIAQIKTELTNGDEIEIITSKNSNPSSAWLHFAKTNKTKSEVKHYLRIKQQKEYEKLGRKIVKSYFESVNLKINDKILEENLSKFSQNSIEEIYAFVGEGIISRKDVLKKIYPDFIKENNKKELNQKIEQKVLHKFNKKQTNKINEISIEGLIKGMAIKFAKCCFPLPGDNILGVINTGIGVTIHKINCKNIQHIANLKEKSLPLKWKNNGNLSNEKYISRINIVLKNQPGSLAEIFNLFTEKKINVSNIKTLTKTLDIQEIEMEIEVKNSEHLSDILASSRALQSIYSIKRFK